MTNSSLNLLVTGGKGQLGTAIEQHYRAKEVELFSCAYEEMDINDLNSIYYALEKYEPNVIVNAAAYTAVDKAEQEIVPAMNANHIGAHNLAIACQKLNIPLIHISTDYVFDGTKYLPYTENDQANPMNVYGKSKWLGEQMVRDTCEQHIILRISGVFSQFNQNFMKTMLRLGSERKELRIVADQITCPTSANDVADAIFTLANNLKHWGTYHYCSHEPTSWYEFAAFILQEAKKTKNLMVEQVHPIPSREFPTPAKRPAYSAMNCQKIKNDYGIEQPSWRDAVKRDLQKTL